MIPASDASELALALALIDHGRALAADGRTHEAVDVLEDVRRLIWRTLERPVAPTPRRSHATFQVIDGGRGASARRAAARTK